MNYSFLSFFLSPMPFYDSAKEMGLYWLITGGVLICCSALLVFIFYVRCFKAKTVDFLKLMFFIPVIILAVIYTNGLKPKTGYLINNFLFKGILESFSDDKKSKVDAEKLISKYLTPKNERYRKLDKSYPLLKYTYGFKGKKLFNIKCDKDETPHIIILFLESFRAADIGVLGAESTPSPSPDFDSLSKEGILFTNFYANGIQTTRAVIATLFGIYPRFTKRAIQSQEYDIPLIGLPQIFRSKGYITGYFHNGSLFFERKDLFFPRHGFDEVHGKDYFLKRHPHAEKTSWGLHDKYLMEDMVKWLKNQDIKGRKAFITAFTITNHHPWKKPVNFKVPDFGVDENDEYYSFLQTFHYTDYALGYFMDLLRKNNLSKKTIVFILSDTPNPMGEHKNNYMLIRYLYEENCRIPFLILADGRIEEPKKIEAVGSQVDILPTILDICNISSVNHSIGTALTRKAERRFAIMNSPFYLKHLAIRQKQYKYIYSCLTGKSKIFNLESDPNERHPLKLPFISGRLKNRLFNTQAIMDYIYRNNAFTPEPKK
ncbi:MAG: LTA synthase family protein [Victivallales bacterium]|nr:LTA synthase family protein [Victivallales bacterium]MCF7888910.1 LTA synthase family protein [Victivallales bacterium]